jgi:tetratricopeptide (TPR) repeat protein
MLFRYKVTSSMQESDGKQDQLPMLRRLSIAVTAAMLWICCSSVVLADKEKSEPEEFYNPLEITTPDPLLPRPVEERPLSSLERLKLTAALEQLNQQAAAQLTAGDRVRAFEIWNRELRLRRALGSLEEVEALSRVGAIAWRENQRAEVRVITRRLQEIQQQTQSQPAIDLKLLQSLGVAFQQVRSPKSAIEVYEQILAAARQQQDQAAAEATLKTLAQLHLSWFDYPSSAAIYEELLGLARAHSDRLSEVKYLQELAYIYKQANQHQQAVQVKQQLAELYLNEAQFTQVPALRLAIASDYESLGKLQEAFQNYQEAYASAWSLQQYARAGNALRNLIVLYRSQGQIDAALGASQILLEADQRAANVYGMMNTYDQLGQIYLERGNFSEALAAFQSGLELAQQLKYQESYFGQQIQQVNQRLSK